MFQEDCRYHEYIRLRLQFFAKEGPGGERTEEPTAKKLSDARKEGQVARSQELIMAASLLALFLILKIFVGWIGKRLIHPQLSEPLSEEEVRILASLVAVECQTCRSFPPFKSFLERIPH